MKTLAILLAVLLAPVVARGDPVPPPAPLSDQQSRLASDPVLEARLRSLELELRCLVCQNQTLADSNAGLAEDLRREVREQARAGKSDAEIREYLHERYGDFIFYRPPVQANTLFLWFGPFLLLVLIVAGLIWRHTRAAGAGPAPLDATRDEAVKRLLG